MSPICGSSPLARGTLRLESHRVPNLRLIPARAGNISLRGASQTPSSAHPRSRGEHRDVSGYTRIDSGSSPLARGTYSCAPHGCPSRRLIPARAGNIANVSDSFAKFPAHPRSRGEHLGLNRGEQRRFGSSPLARGTWVPPYSETQTYRLIPARAGNMVTCRPWGLCWAAHPRSRGEHWQVHRPLVRTPGSSPLARGTWWNGRAGETWGRLIPARAGNIQDL